MARKTHEELKANPAVNFIILKEIARHPGGFAGWEVDDIARIEKNRPHADAWAYETARNFRG